MKWAICPIFDNLVGEKENGNVKKTPLRKKRSKADTPRKKESGSKCERDHVESTENRSGRGWYYHHN